MYNVIDCVMSGNSAEAERTGQAMAASGVDSGSTSTYVWFTYCGPKAQADRHPNVLVVQSQPTCCYW